MSLKGLAPVHPASAVGPERDTRKNGVPFRIADGRVRLAAVKVPQEQGLIMKYNHVGIPTTASFDGEIPLAHLKVTVSDHQNNPFGIQWQRYWDDAPYPDLVKTVPHVAFEVDDLAEAIRDQKVIVAPNSPSTGVLVAMIEVNGAPVELMQIDHSVRKDL
jgi:hypothetical protein